MAIDSRGPVQISAPVEDHAAVRRCLAGDLGAFDGLVHRYQDRVFALCLWMLANRDDAEDAAQDAFVRAFRGLANFRGDCAFSTWLHRIAVNAALDLSHRRSRAPLPYAALLSDEESLPPEAIDPEESPADLACRRERREAILSALRELPEQHRVAIVLFDIQGYAYEEVAAMLELPLGTVKSRLNRARLAMRAKLEDQRELFQS